MLMKFVSFAPTETKESLCFFNGYKPIWNQGVNIATDHSVTLDERSSLLFQTIITDSSFLIEVAALAANRVGSLFNCASIIARIRRLLYNHCYRLISQQFKKRLKT